MLLKIGWQEGESLGANNSGIQQPVSTSLCMLLSNYLLESLHLSSYWFVLTSVNSTKTYVTHVPVPQLKRYHTSQCM